MPDRRLPGGVATGVGSMPGEDIGEAVNLVFGEVADFPFLPELPARGVGTDMIGRGAALLTDLPVELYAGTWQMAARAGKDSRRARDFLERDLDALTDHVSEHDGVIKVAAAGPWTLAASLQRTMGGAMLADPGACREITDSVADGLAGYVRAVGARLPRANVVLQLDEPSLVAVLRGTVPTLSGWSRYAPVESQVVIQALRSVVEAAEVPVVIHCCAAEVPLDVVLATGAAGVSLDLSSLDTTDITVLDAFGEAMEAGFGLLAGVVPATEEFSGVTASAATESITALWNRLGLEQWRLPQQVCVTARCGLAGASPRHARETLGRCRESARQLHG